MLHGSTRRAFIRASGAAVTVTGLAGCTLIGSSEDGGPLTVGATVPDTGRMSGLGKEVRQGYELGVSHINENGGIDGRDLELVIEDDQSDPKKARNLLQNVLNEESPAMLWRSITSALVTAGSSVAEQENVPFLGVGFAHEAPHVDNDFEWTYVPYPKSRHVARGTKRLFDGLPESMRPSTVAIWQPNSGWGAEMAAEWRSHLSDAGYDVVLDRKFSMGNKDFSSLISETKSAEAEVLLSNPIPPDGITAVKQMKSGNYTPKAMMFVRASHSNGWWRALGEQGAYTVTSPGWVPGLEGNGNQRFKDAYRSEYDTEGLTTPVTVGAAYTLTQVAADALQAVEDTSPDAIQSTLRSETFQTIMGTLAFANNGVISGDHFVTPSGQWWESEQRVVFPEVETDLSMDFRYPMAPWNER